jgi:predicted deacylase
MTIAFDPGKDAAEELGIDIHDFGPPSAPVGRSVYLQGQLHANESAAMLVLHELTRKLRRDAPDNLVRIVPNANPIGWTRYVNSGEGRLSADGMNWNRLFAAPVSRAETVDEQLARALWLLSGAFDVVIDVHTPEFGWPHLYASTAQRRLLTMDHIPHILYGAPVSATFDESHLRLRDGLGLPPVWASVTLEVPSHQIPDDDFVDHWSECLLAEIDAQAKSRELEGSPELHGQIVDIIAQTTGATVLHCEPGRVLAVGAPILTVHGMKGATETLYAPERCVPVCFRRATLVEAGYWACRVIVLE